MSTTTTTASASIATSNQPSPKEIIIDLCTTVGEVFSKFSVLLRDLDANYQNILSANEQNQAAAGWDEQSVAMFRQAVETFGISVRDISTAVAEKRIRER
ncbi:unnamed protein product [Adineta ricciae]|uniref:Uncharacterized protein n=1 Tax=Adineta ricciae TaxID=249248 RepID=A0A813WJI1_ADIRI|nr:unnamed protein product [Adineta ricciae]CAF0910703.1 unnamed protein product [Adineta ricciae]